MADKELKNLDLREIAEGKMVSQMVGQHRSTQRHQPEVTDPDRDLRRRLRDFARHHPRWGYRRDHAVLSREGHHLNRKKVQRIWREEGLRVPAKRQRLGISSTLAERLSATHPDHVWALDYQLDVTTYGKTLKILRVTDEFTRESLCDLVAHPIDADATVDALERIAAGRGTFPGFVRMDNGPRAHRQCAARLVPLQRHGDELRRTGELLAEPLGRVLGLSDA